MSTRKTTLDGNDNINTNLNEIGWVGVDLIRLVEVRFQWQVHVFPEKLNCQLLNKTSTPWGWFNFLQSYTCLLAENVRLVTFVFFNHSLRSFNHLPAIHGQKMHARLRCFHSHLAEHTTLLNTFTEQPPHLPFGYADPKRPVTVSKLSLFDTLDSIGWTRN